MSMKTLIRAVLAVALASGVLAACGEDALEGIGDRSRDFIYGSTTTTTEFVIQDEVIRIDIVNVTELDWFNDDIEGQRIGEPGYVAAQVWGRSDGTTRFIQASRVEIAAALPNVGFPELVPDDVSFITSQLVFDLASGTIDTETSAAFGLWVVEPYTVSDGSIAVLRVGSAGEDAGLGRSAIVVDPVESGISLSWTEGEYRYELFCRATISPDTCEEIAKTTAPLRLMLPEDIDLPAGEDA